MSTDNETSPYEELPFVHHTFISGICDSALYIPQTGGLNVILNSRELTIEVHRAFNTSNSDFEQIRLLDSLLVTSKDTTVIRNVSIKDVVIGYFERIGLNCEHEAKNTNEQILPGTNTAVGKSHGVLADGYNIVSVVFNWPSYAILAIRDPNGNLHLMLLRLPGLYLSLRNSDQSYISLDSISQIRTLVKRDESEYDPMEDFTPSLNGNASTPVNLSLDRSISLISSVIIHSAEEYLLASAAGASICTNPSNIRLHDLSIINIKSDANNRQQTIVNFENGDVCPVVMGCVEYVNNVDDSLHSASCGGFVFAWNPIEPMIRKLIIFAEPPKSIQKKIRKVKESESMKSSPGIFYHADKNQFYISPYLGKSHNKKRERPTSFTYGNYELMTNASHTMAFIGTSFGRVFIMDVQYLLDGIDDLSSSLVCSLTINSSTYIKKDGIKKQKDSLYHGCIRKLVVNRDGVFALVQTNEMANSVDPIMNPDSLMNCDVFAFWAANSLIAFVKAAKLTKKTEKTVNIVSAIKQDIEEVIGEDEVEKLKEEKEKEESHKEQEKKEEENIDIKDEKENKENEEEKEKKPEEKFKIIKTKKTTTTTKETKTKFYIRYRCEKIAVYIPSSSLTTTSYPTDNIQNSRGGYMTFYTIPTVPSTIARHTIDEASMCCISSILMTKAVTEAEAKLRQANESSTEGENNQNADQSTGNSNPCQGILLGFTNGDVAFCTIRFPSEATAELAAVTLPNLSLDWYGKNVLSTRIYNLAGAEVILPNDTNTDASAIAKLIGASQITTAIQQADILDEEEDSIDEDATSVQSGQNVNVTHIQSNSTERVSKGKLAERKSNPIAVRIQVASKNALVVFTLPQDVYSGIASGALETKTTEVNISVLTDKQSEATTPSAKNIGSTINNLNPNLKPFQMGPQGNISSMIQMQSPQSIQNTLTPISYNKKVKMLAALRQRMVQWSSTFPSVLQSLCVTPENRRIITAYLAKYIANTDSNDKNKMVEECNIKVSEADDVRVRFAENLTDFIGDIYRIIRSYSSHPILNIDSAIELLRENGEKEIIEEVTKKLDKRIEYEGKKDFYLSQLPDDADEKEINKIIDKKVGWTSDEVEKEKNINDDLKFFIYLISSSNIIPLNYGEKQAAKIASAMTSHANTVDILSLITNNSEENVMNSDLMKSAMEIECNSYPISEEAISQIPGICTFIYHLRNIVSKTFEALGLNEDCMQPAVNELQEQVQRLNSLLYGNETKTIKTTTKDETNKEIEVNIDSEAMTLFDIFEKEEIPDNIDFVTLNDMCFKSEKVDIETDVEEKIYQKVEKIEEEKEIKEEVEETNEKKEEKEEKEEKEDEKKPEVKEGIIVETKIKETVDEVESEQEEDETEEKDLIKTNNIHTEKITYRYIEDVKKDQSNTKKTIVNRVTQYLRNLRQRAEKIVDDKFNKMMISFGNEAEEEDSFSYFVSSSNDESFTEKYYESESESESESNHEEVEGENNELNEPKIEETANEVVVEETKEEINKDTSKENKERKLAKVIHKKKINCSANLISDYIENINYKYIDENKKEDEKKKSMSNEKVESIEEEEEDKKTKDRMDKILDIYRELALPATSTYTSLRIITAQKLSAAMKNTETILLSQFVNNLPHELVVNNRFVFMPFLNKPSILTNASGRHYLLEATSSGITRIQQHDAKLFATRAEAEEKEKGLITKEQQLKAGSLQYHQISAAMAKIRETGKPNDQELFKQYQALNQRLQYLQSGLKKIQEEIATDKNSLTSIYQNLLRDRVRLFGVDAASEIAANSSLMHLNHPGDFVDVLDLNNVNTTVCTSIATKIYSEDMPDNEKLNEDDKNQSKNDKKKADAENDTVVSRSLFESQMKMLGYQAVMSIETLANLDPMNRFLRPADTDVIRVPTYSNEAVETKDKNKDNILRRIGLKTALKGPLGYSTVVFFNKPSNTVRLDVILACLQYKNLPEVRKYLDENKYENMIVSNFSNYFTNEKKVKAFTSSLLEIIYIVQYFYSNLNQSLGGNGFIYGLNYLRPSTLYIRCEKEKDEITFTPVIAHPGMISTAIPTFNEIVEYDGIWCSPETLLGITSTDNQMKSDMWSVSLLIISIMLAACGHFDSCPVNIEALWVESEKINKARYDYIRRNNPNVEEIFKPSGSEIFRDVDSNLIGSMLQNGAVANNRIMGARRLSVALRACAKAAMDIATPLNVTEEDIRAFVFFNQPSQVTPNSQMKDLEYIKSIYQNGSLANDIAGHIAPKLLYESLSAAFTADPSANSSINATVFSQNAILAAASKHPETRKLFVGFSVEARDFLARCLNFNPEKRLNLEDSLSHQWFTKENEAAENKPETEKKTENDTEASPNDTIKSEATPKINVIINKEVTQKKVDSFQLDEDAERVII